MNSKPLYLISKLFSNSNKTKNSNKNNKETVKVSTRSKSVGCESKKNNENISSLASKSPISNRKKNATPKSARKHFYPP